MNDIQFEYIARFAPKIIGGGYNSLGNFANPQFPYRRTRTADTYLFPAWKQGNFIWRETTPLLGSGGFLPPDHPLSPAPLGAAAPRPCVRQFATLTASLPSFPAENSRLFLQKIQKLAFISAKTFSMSQKSCVRASKVRVRKASIARQSLAYDFLFARNARIFAARQSLATKNTKIRGAFLGKMRTHFARLAHFWGKCGRILLAWRVFGESASAFCFAGTISGKMRLRTARLA